MFINTIILSTIKILCLKRFRTNKNITNRSRIVNFEDTRGRWSEYLCLKLSAYKKGTSITLDLSIGFLDGEIYSSFFTMKL